MWNTKALRSRWSRQGAHSHLPEFNVWGVRVCDGFLCADDAQCSDV